ncbi:MAG: ABC transporter ATP-binding protein, partial [Terriglobia bacterium]
GLLGPNGAGKTTTISMLCGLVPSDGGEITIAGHAGGTLEAKASVGYVPQDLALYPDLSAVENLTFFGELYRLSGKELQTRIAETLELVGLADRGKDRIGTYSGGMKRRLDLGASLVGAPRLLLLDEPTTGLDPQSRRQLWERIETMKKAGRSVLLTTHSMEEAQAICDRVAIMDHGRIIAVDNPTALVEKHKDDADVRAVMRLPYPTLEDVFISLTGRAVRR